MPTPKALRGFLSLALIASVLGFMPGASGAPKLVTLGTDATGDAPPSLDLTYLKVGRSGANLEIRLGIEGIVPELEGADLAGVEWIFKSRNKTYLAEAYSEMGEPGFLLFQVTRSSFKEIATLKGTYDHVDGFARILVPLKKIGASRGTKIAGVGEADVDSHVHALVTTHYSDTMKTTRAYVIP
jgi:hypothetical protein